MFHGVKREKLNQEAVNAKLQRDKAKITHYNGLKNKVFEARDDNTYTVETLNLVTDLLMLNPEFYTVWNIRREMLVNLFKTGDLDKISTLNDDLKLVMVLFKRFPKCYWIYNHRLWVLKMLGEKADWKFELGIVSKLLTLDQRNFHGWQLRRVITDNLENTVDSPVKSLLINLNEFEFSTSKVNNNISNFSAWHNRSKLIPKIYELYKQIDPEVISQNEQLHKHAGSFKDPKTLLQHEIKLINTGMYVDADDTSVWLYLYWLLTDKFFTDTVTKDTYISTLQQQLQLIQELNELEKSDNDKDNCWCVKTTILIKCLIKRREGQTDLLTNEIKAHLQILIGIDPLRKGRYMDQLTGKAELLY